MVAYLVQPRARLDELATAPWTFSDYPLELTQDEARTLTGESPH